MDNKNEWLQAKSAVNKSAEELEKAEKQDEINAKHDAADSEALEKREKEAERLGQPAKILVNRGQLNSFLKNGQLNIAGLAFGDRILNPGDVVILEDENRKEWSAELVSIEKTKAGNDRVVVKSLPS